MEDRACRVDFVGDPPSSTFYPRLVELQPSLKQLGRELRIEDGGWIAGVLSRDSLSSILVSSTPIPPPSRDFSCTRCKARPDSIQTPPCSRAPSASLIESR